MREHPDDPANTLCFAHGSFREDQISEMYK